MDEVRIGGWRLVERPRGRFASPFPLIPSYSLLFFFPRLVSVTFLNSRIAKITNNQLTRNRNVFIFAICK